MNSSENSGTTSPSSSMTCSALFREYAAMQFYRMACRNKSIPVRWGVLRGDLREKYLATADAAVTSWADEEGKKPVSGETRDCPAHFLSLTSKVGHGAGNEMPATEPKYL